VNCLPLQKPRHAFSNIAKILLHMDASTTSSARFVLVRREAGYVHGSRVRLSNRSHSGFACRKPVTPASLQRSFIQQTHLHSRHFNWQVSSVYTIRSTFHDYTTEYTIPQTWLAAHNPCTSLDDNAVKPIHTVAQTLNSKVFNYPTASMLLN
jgi:hypothetical protein